MLTFFKIPRGIVLKLNYSRLAAHKALTHNELLHLAAQVRRALNTLAPGYQPKIVEANRQRSDDVCNGLVANRGTFRMLLPPPNVTGDLHLGHALMATVQDAICRQQRQRGNEVVWLPGTDHAGIATQVVVERKLFKETGLTRKQIGRDAFLQEVWNWKEHKATAIMDDLSKLGCTLDWNKEYFTMDQLQAHAVNTAFIRLFEDGLITRRKALINWSCALESAISDIEVENVSIKEPTELAVPGYDEKILFGKIYDISYRVCDSEEEIVVSTTRPETMLGDVAVAVNPNDERYVKYRNMQELKLWHPFRKEPIPLIFDFSVDESIGTGAVKVTPAHDKNDFRMAQRHLLESIPVFTENGHITNEIKTDFAGLPRFVARDRLLEQLGQLDLLRDIRDHAMTLPLCSRSRDIVEYMVRPQWFLHCQPLADAAASEVASGRLKIVPSNFEVEWQRWLADCHDWCISRQLWWGHRIPVYLATDIAGNSVWVVGLNETDAMEKAREKLKTNYFTIKQETDVLDTWFSSALLPFSTTGWPTNAYKENYPLDLLETGHDILFFWVARMVMLGLKLTGTSPFKKVLLNGIICDANGRKMSKSLGNVISPQHVVQGATKEILQQEVKKAHLNGMLSYEELQKSLKGIKRMFPNGIPECGTDALRFTLLSHNIKNHFLNFDVAECYANKLFLNKIWQATRYTLGAAEQLKFDLSEVETLNNAPLNKWDRWIVSRLAHTLTLCTESFEEYNLHLATAALKQFFYQNLCDVYVETTKQHIKDSKLEGYVHCATLATCIQWGLQAMWPFTPFISSELLQYLPQKLTINLLQFRNVDLENEVQDILTVCQAIRKIKSRNQISKMHAPTVNVYAENVDVFRLMNTYLDEIKLLTQTCGVNVKLKSEVDIENEQHKNFYTTANHLCAFSISTNSSYDHKGTPAKNVLLNQGKLEKLRDDLKRYRDRVSNVGFLKSASEQVQREHMEKVRDVMCFFLCERIRQLEAQIQNIKVVEGKC